MTRPAHFADAHGVDRRAWLAGMQAESNDEAAGGRGLIGLLALVVLSVTVGVVFADWMTGEHYLGTAVRAWQASR